MSVLRWENGVKKGRNGFSLDENHLWAWPKTMKVFVLSWMSYNPCFTIITSYALDIKENVPRTLAFNIFYDTSLESTLLRKIDVFHIRKV